MVGWLFGISTSFNRINFLPETAADPRGMARFVAFNCPTSVPSWKNAAVATVTSDNVREIAGQKEMFFCLEGWINCL